MHLRNVPPLRDVQADFKPGLNIIIGKNGSGKTNFMKLVSELADLDTEKHRGIGCTVTLAAYGHDINLAFEARKAQKKVSKQSITLRTNTARTPLVVVASSGSETAKHESALAATFVVASAVGSASWEAGYDIVSIWHGLPNHTLEIIDKSAELSFDNQAEMIMSSEVWAQKGVFERALFDSIIPYGFSSLAKEFITIDPAPLHHLILEAIAAQLETINLYLPVYSPIEKVRLGEQFRVYHNSTTDEKIVKGLMLEYLVAGDWLPFSALSDGTKRIFYLIGELKANSMLFDDDFTSIKDKIIFLEEPELGIHPDQLQLLLQLIREVSNEHQVILTTHSPQTLDMLSAQELDRITICEFIPGKGTQMRKLSPAKRKKAKAYLADEGFLSEFWRFSNLEDPD
ncbi:MAG: ATP-binding protein [Bacteroidota bacterium]|nr:ATP-binding protein [Bacteroidota bacterium]